jgi:hypothetical protein
MKIHTVYLYRSPDCIRGWLSYLHPEHARRCTFTVEVEAETGPKAKNKAITCANNGFEGVKIVGRNFDDKLWGINNYPELKGI